MPNVYIQNPVLKVKEGSSFNVTAYFRNGDAAQASTTAKYRIDCLTTGSVLKEWTSLTVAVSISIPITATHNAIQNSRNVSETKQITVASDPDTDTQTRDVSSWVVQNIQGF